MNSLTKIVTSMTFALSALCHPVNAQQYRIRIGEEVSHQHNRFFDALPYGHNWGQYRDRYHNGSRGNYISMRLGDFFFSYEERPERRVYSPWRKKQTVCEPRQKRR